MAWYSAGTVSVTNGSTSVIGTGTSFIQNVKSGDIFIALTDGGIYEVDEVVSATALTLKRPYGGATTFQVAYEVVPTSSYLKTLATQVTDLIALYTAIPDDVSASQDAAAASAAAAADSATSAGQAAQSASAFKDAAAASATAAGASASNASASAATAGQRLTDAQTAAANAATARDAAQAAQTAAQTARDSSQTYAANAQNWASQSSGTVDGTNYSAKFYAAQAAASAASITLPLPVASGGTGSTTAAAALSALGGAPKASPTFTGTVTLPQFTLISSAAGNARQFSWQTAGLNRWIMSTNATAETGANAGSDWSLDRYTDAGAYADTPLSIKRSSGQATFSQRPLFGANLAWDSGNLNPAIYAQLSTAAFTGAVSIKGTPWAASALSTRNDATTVWGVSGYASYQSSGGAFIGRVDSPSTSLASWFFGTAGVGSITTNGSSTTYGTTSDYRLKQDVVTLSGDDAVALIRQGRPVRYTFVSDDTNAPHIGFIAHEYQAVQPEAVTGVKDGTAMSAIPSYDADGNMVTDPEGNPVYQIAPQYQNMDYAKPTPILWAALKQALEEIDALKTQVAALTPNATPST
jgi:hypothetical protein